MFIYTDFVFDDKLVSPINGREVKFITNQNIKQFGFNSKEELLNLYPDFPLICKDTSDKRSANRSLANSTKRDNRKELNFIKNTENYLTNQKFCKKCKKLIPFEIRNNVFCSLKCANSRIWSDKDKLKKSISYKNTVENSIQYKNWQLSRKPKLIENLCYICNKSIIVSIKDNRKYKVCSDYYCKKIHRYNCDVRAGQAAARKINKRSKLEIELADLCAKHFNILTNEPIANGWDADILLTDYKIAILWNGPWHYKEMFGNHSLAQVVNRDIIKIIEFEKIGWQVLIYQDNEWSPLEALIDILIKVR